MCGDTVDNNGVPILDPAKCGPDNGPQPQPQPWEPIYITPAKQCVDVTLYHSNKSGPWNIYRLGTTPDQSAKDDDVSQGSGPNVRDISPSRSPDNNWAAFTSNRSGNWEIYLSSLDGSKQQRVTYTTTAANLAPAWSPDGQYVAYESTRTGSRNIFVVETATGVETQLTEGPAQSVNPFWSPDSKQLVFQSDQSGLWQVYVLDIATKKVSLLSNGKTNDMNPQFSSDGKKIAYRSYAGSTNSVIYVMNADGSDAKAASDPKGNATNLAWSPDNSLIAYQSNLDGDQDVFVYQVSSGTVRKITDDTKGDFAPTWRCNSNTLIFTSDAGGNPNIYQASALPINAAPVKPAGFTQLTKDTANDQYPQNSPSVEDASYRSQSVSAKTQSGG